MCQLLGAFGRLDSTPTPQREHELVRGEKDPAAGAAREERDARYFLRLAQEVQPELRGHRQGDFLERLAREHDNLRAAMASLLEGNGDESVQVVAALANYWSDRGHYREGKDWMDRALAKRTEASHDRVRLLRYSSVMRMMLGDNEGAKGRLNEALPMALARGERHLAALTLSALGTVAVSERRFAEAKEYFEEGLAIARDLGDPTVMGTLLTNLGEVTRGERAWARGRAMGLEAAVAEALEEE